MKNDEYEKALKISQTEILKARQLTVDLDILQKNHQEDSEKFLDLQRATQDIGLHRSNIKKQEELISQLEAKLETAINNSKKQKAGKLEMEQLKTENKKLQSELKNLVINTNPGILAIGNPDIEKYKNEVARLEGIVNNLQNDINHKRPFSSEKKMLQSEITDLEVKLHKSQARVQSYEDDLQYIEKKNASEIARIKMMIAEKETTIDTLVRET